MYIIMCVFTYECNQKHINEYQYSLRDKPYIQCLQPIETPQDMT